MNSDPSYRDPLACWGRTRTIADPEKDGGTPEEKAARAKRNALALALTEHPSSSRSVFWFWLTITTPENAFDLARLAFWDNRAYQNKKRELGLAGRLIA